MPKLAPEADPIFALINAHARAYARLDIGPPENDEQLLEYFCREQEEGMSLSDLARKAPATIAGARALITYTARCFRLQSWDETTVRSVLNNVMLPVAEALPDQTLKAIEARLEASPDPVVAAMKAHARVSNIIKNWGSEDLTEEIVDEETAACDRFSLTIPMTPFSVCLMIAYALHSSLYADWQEGGKTAAAAAMLASLLRSPVFNASPAKAAA